MVISRIASRGLHWGDNNHIPPTKMTTFHGNIIAFSKSMPSAYYVPLKFNHKAVDAVYVEVDEHQNTATVVAIQITVGKRHRDSAADFFAQWGQWTDSLKGFTIRPVFLWIVEGTRGQPDVEEKLRELRTGQVTLWPKHVTHWVSIDQVDKNLAGTLARIRAEG
jgi:mannose-6-phosphate isomerase-like protein (cupin superfamily)